MVLHIAVCDDEPVFKEHIRSLLVSDSILKGYELNKVYIFRDDRRKLQEETHSCRKRKPAVKGKK